MQPDNPWLVEEEESRLPWDQDGRTDPGLCGLDKRECSVPAGHLSSDMQGQMALQTKVSDLRNGGTDLFVHLCWSIYICF